MSYLKHEPVMVTKLTCSHPKVNKIWEFGGGSANQTDSAIHHYVTMILNINDNERIDFEIKDQDYSEIEKYLENL